MSKQAYRETVLFENGSAGGAGPEWRDLLERNGIRITSTVSNLDALSRRVPGRNGCLLVAGGDGTLNEAMRHVLHHECTLGVLPGGTGNDFARSLGIPLDPESACRALASAVEREVDIAEINDQLLLNASHIGLGSDVSSRDAGRFKQGWGRMSYLRGLFENLFGLNGFRATIRLNDATWSDRWVNVSIANGRCFGGGYIVDEQARLDDGLLDVVALKQRPWWQLLWAAVLKHTGNEYPDAVQHWRVAEVSVETVNQHCVVVDGDVRTNAPVHARVLPAAIRVLVADAGAGLENRIERKSDAA